MIRENLNLYKFFYHVARTGSVSLAAKQLYVTQPAVSHAIKQLEEALRCKLFERVNRRLFLTSAGIELYKAAEQIIDSLERAKVEILDVALTTAGSVKISGGHIHFHYHLMDTLGHFHAVFPNIKLHVRTSVTPEVIKAVQKENIDIGFVTTSPLQTEFPKDLVFKELYKVQDVFFVGRAYNYLCNRAMTLEEVATFPLVCNTRGHPRRERIEYIFNQANATISSVFSTNMLDLTVGFVENGFGIGLMPLSVIKRIDPKGKRLFVLKLKEKIKKEKFGYLYSNLNPLSLSAQTFIKFLDENPPQI